MPTIQRTNPPPTRTPAPNVVKNDEQEKLERICELAQGGATKAEIQAAILDAMPEMEPLNSGIIRTSTGALMVRLSDTRWPMTMYKKDWRILLRKVPAIEKALDTLDILEENPNPKGKVAAREEEVAERRTA